MKKIEEEKAFSQEKVSLKPKQKKPKKFIKSMDYEWFLAVAHLPGKGSLLIGIGLYFWASIFRKGFEKEFKLSVSRLGQELGIDDSTAYRGLKSLVKAGLVTIKHNIGKKPTLILHNPCSDLPTPSENASGPANTFFENLGGKKSSFPEGNGRDCEGP